MHQLLEYKCSSNISEKEKTTLEGILSRYGFKVLLIEKVRSAFKVYTDQGIFCLKKISNGHRRAKKSHFIAQKLKENGFPNVAAYYPDCENNLFVKNKKSTFYLTYWIDSREASFGSCEDILESAELLAKFHLHSKEIKNFDNIRIRTHYKSWPKSFGRCCEDIKLFSKVIGNSESKNEFDNLYIENSDYFYKEGMTALSLLERQEYSILCREMEHKKYICHNSFYYQNILFGSDGQLYVIDLESCIIDLPVSDLGKLIRRIMNKRKYAWDFDFCRKIIDSYNSIRPMSKEEYILLLVMLLFPHKFWKLGRKRYVKNKNWCEDKYCRKLKKLIKLRKNKEEFLNVFVGFYNLDVLTDNTTTS